MKGGSNDWLLIPNAILNALHYSRQTSLDFVNSKPGYPIAVKHVGSVVLVKAAQYTHRKTMKKGAFPLGKNPKSGHFALNVTFSGWRITL